jgi:hypothetical protein
MGSEYGMMCAISNIAFGADSRVDAAREIVAYAKDHNFEKYTREEHVQGVIDAVRGEDWGRGSKPIRVWQTTGFRTTQRVPFPFRRKRVPRDGRSGRQFPGGGWR